MSNDPQVAPSKFLTVEEILNADDRKIVPHEVPEWGGTLKLRAMSLNQLIALQKLMKGAVEDASFMAEIVALCVVGDDGKPLFKREHMPQLMEKNLAVFQNLQKAVSALNGLDKTGDPKVAIDAAKNV